MLSARVKKGSLVWEHNHIAKSVLEKYEGEIVSVSVSKPKSKRSLAQNRLIHSIVTDLSLQLDYPEQSGTYRTKECWKDIIAAGVKIALYELEAIPAPESDFVVVLGLHTSKMSVMEMGEFIEYAHSYGTKRGVVWSKTSLSEKT